VNGPEFDAIDQWLVAATVERSGLRLQASDPSPVTRELALAGMSRSLDEAIGKVRELHAAAKEYIAALEGQEFWPQSCQ
jgi:hypothetical protein